MAAKKRTVINTRQQSKTVQARAKRTIDNDDSLSDLVVLVARRVAKILERRMRNLHLHLSKDNIVKSMQVLPAKPGDLVVLSVRPQQSIEKLDAILRNYAPIFARHGLDVLVTDGVCDIRLIQKLPT